MFDNLIVNLDAVSYLRMAPEKALAKAEKENKDLYIQACLERRQAFTPMVYSTDGIPGAEALAAQKRLASLLSYKLKREYSEMCVFGKASMSLSIVRSNRGAHPAATIADGLGGDGSSRTLAWLNPGDIEGKGGKNHGQGLVHSAGK